MNCFLYIIMTTDYSEIEIFFYIETNYEQVKKVGYNPNQKLSIQNYNYSYINVDTIEF